MTNKTHTCGDPAKIEADAHLIAAAPEMLAALLTCSCPGGGWTGMPKEITHPTVKDCLTYGVCGCNLGDAVKKAKGPLSRLRCAV